MLFEFDFKRIMKNQQLRIRFLINPLNSTINFEPVATLESLFVNTFA